MDKSEYLNEYLIARIGNIKLGVYCRDVGNVFTEKVKLFRLFNQGGFFKGLAVLNGQIMQVLDLRTRIGMAEREKTEKMTLISFNTGQQARLAVIVDEIIGMQRVTTDCIHKNNKSLGNRHQNIDLLFPMVAVMNDGSLKNKTKDQGLIHILDSTYLEKIDPIEDDAGELELF